MSTIKSVLWRMWRVVRWPIGVLAAAYIALFLYVFATDARDIDNTVNKIHASKITMADVDGSNLPPKPDPKLADATVEGVDTNENGIRDDVELAIFAKYPNDLKTRAAALQYAKAEQWFLSDEIVDTKTWKAAAEVSGRANLCMRNLGRGVSNTVATYVEVLTVNTDQRKNKYKNVHQFTTSVGDQPGMECDVQI